MYWHSYYDFMWVRHKTFNMNENVLMELPETLSLKVLDHTHRHVMDRSVVFRELNKSFQRAMASLVPSHTCFCRFARFYFICE